MTNYCEYATVNDFRSTWQGSLADDTLQDTLLLQLIRGVSREMEQGGRWYYPRIETRYYDKAPGRQLDFPETDWLETTTVTNGDGTTVNSSNYDLLPYNYTPYYAIRLTLTSGLIWLLNSVGSPEKAITIAGIAGYMKDYNSAWPASTSTIQNNPLAAGGTSITVSANNDQFYAGQLLKLGAVNDYAYVSSVATTTLTVVRSVNGSTGIAHAQGEALAVFDPGWDIANLCRSAVAARLKLKDNPTGETVQIGGATFSTPKDVTAWITKQLGELGYAQLY